MLTGRIRKRENKGRRKGIASEAPNKCRHRPTPVLPLPLICSSHNLYLPLKLKALGALNATLPLRSFYLTHLALIDLTRHAGQLAQAFSGGGPHAIHQGGKFPLSAQLPPVAQAHVYILTSLIIFSLASSLLAQAASAANSSKTSS